MDSETVVNKELARASYLYIHVCFDLNKITVNFKIVFLFFFVFNYLVEGVVLHIFFRLGLK